MYFNSFSTAIVGYSSIEFLALTCTCYIFKYWRMFNVQGELTYGKIGEWRFDKRSYLRGPPPKNLPLPPPGVPESVVSRCKMSPVTL